MARSRTDRHVGGGVIEAATAVETGEVADRDAGPTGSREADAVSAGRVQRFHYEGYLSRDPEKAHLAERLLRWLAQSTVREYVSPTGYRMLIVDRHDGT